MMHSGVDHQITVRSQIETVCQIEHFIFVDLTQWLRDRSRWTTRKSNLIGGIGSRNRRTNKTIASTIQTVTFVYEAGNE
jgi:hypothetical protein